MRTFAPRALPKTRSTAMDRKAKWSPLRLVAFIVAVSGVFWWAFATLIVMVTHPQPHTRGGRACGD